MHLSCFALGTISSCLLSPQLSSICLFLDVPLSGVMSISNSVKTGPLKKLLCRRDDSLSQTDLASNSLCYDEAQTIRIGKLVTAEPWFPDVI